MRSRGVDFSAQRPTLIAAIVPVITSRMSPGDAVADRARQRPTLAHGLAVDRHRRQKKPRYADDAPAGTGYECTSGPASELLDEAQQPRLVHDRCAQ